MITESTYDTTLANEFDYITPANETKWGSIQPVDPDHWDFTRADAIIDFADQHHQGVKGHTLIWHNQLPPFVTDALTPDQLLQYVKRNIHAVVHRYRHQIRAWDVVNEAMGDDAALRDTVFLRKLGPGYIAMAFREAHAADPGADLYYNDYSIDTINAKSDAVYALVRGLKEAHVPIDGVGFQMHLEAQNAPTTEAIVANLSRFADLGLSVNISELDVRVAHLPGDRATRLAVQKQVYQRVVAACMQVHRCVSVTTWGLTDKYSWIDATFGPDDPLELDEAYQRKPAYYGMIDGFVRVPADPPGTRPNLIANASFEVGTDGWSVFAGTLATSRHHAHTGERSAVVTDRTATWQGPVYELAGLVANGRAYDASIWVKIDAHSDTVRLSAKSRCSGGTDQFTTLATDTAHRHGWVQLAGVLTAPICPLDELAIYVEGPAPGVAIFVDDAALRPQDLGFGPNVITNPGFELGTTGWFGFGSPTVTASTAQAHGPTHSGLVTNRTATFMGAAQNLLGAVIPGGVYQLNAWVQLDGAATSEVDATLKSTCAGVDHFQRLASTTATAAAFTQISGSFTVPDCGATGLTMYFEGPAAGVNYYLDDVSVALDLSTVGPNYIANSGFEVDASGWFGFGGPTVVSSAAQAHSGSRSGYATNRTATFQGPATSLLGLATPGTYQASGWVRLEGEASGEIDMTLKTSCAGTDTFTRIGSVIASDSGFASIIGTFTVPACALTDLTVYFEGPPAGINLYIDDIAIRARPPIVPANLVANPDFETSTSGWVAWAGAVITQTTAQAHGGTHSAVVTNRTATFQGPVYNLLPVAVGGTAYSVSAWARLGGVASDAVFITAKTVCSDGTTNFTRVGTGTGSDAAWTLQGGTLTVPTCPLTELSLYLEGPAPGVDLYVDDVSVTGP